MSGTILTFLFGFVIGVLAVAIGVTSTNNITTQGKKAIAECEASLSRNQHCKITAVVDEGP